MTGKRHAHLLLPILLILLIHMAATADVPRVSNTLTPSQGETTIRLEADWSVGGEDDDVFFGVVGQAIVDDDGNVYLLDSQLSEVQVYSPEGEHLRTLSREGDGPGEVRRPSELILLPGPELGISMGFPGKIVALTLDGTPSRSITPGSDPTSGGFNILFTADYKADRLVACCATMSPGDNGFERRMYLASFDLDGRELVRFEEKTTLNDPGKPTYVEKDEYFVQRRWAMDDRGRIYTAPVRDAYEIHVYEPDGTPELIFDLPHEPYRRTADEKDILGSEVVMIANGRRLEVENKIEDREPCIDRLRVDADGNIVVLHSMSSRVLPDGVFRTCDVFSPDGVYLRRVWIACEGDPEEDGLIPLDDGRYLLVRGLQSAREAANARFGADDDSSEETEEADPLEVVCLRPVES